MVASDEKQGQANKADSKDFIEHLRTVHFTLVTVCLALIVILEFPSPFSIREAIRQLNTIVDVTTQWKSTWIDDSVPVQVGAEEYSAHCANSVSPTFTIKPFTIEFTKPNWTIRTSDTQPISTKLTELDKKQFLLSRSGGLRTSSIYGIRSIR